VLNEDQYIERTPDLVAKVRKMRETAEKEMNRFTRVSDYHVRRVVGHGPKPVPVSGETVSANERPKKSAAKSASAQTTLEFAPAHAEHGDGEHA
jgi:hypothetical protein